MIASSHCVEGCSHVCACDRVPVHSVFKADPIKQTEPGHGRIAWKRVGEGWRGMERMGRDGARGHEGRNTMGEREQPESQGEITSGRMVEGTERLRGRGQRCHANVCIGEAVLEVQPKALKPSATQVTCVGLVLCNRTVMSKIRI